MIKIQFKNLPKNVCQKAPDPLYVTPEVILDLLFLSLLLEVAAGFRFFALLREFPAEKRWKFFPAFDFGGLTWSRKFWE